VTPLPGPGATGRDILVPVRPTVSGTALFSPTPTSGAADISSLSQPDELDDDPNVLEDGDSADEEADLLAALLALGSEQADDSSVAESVGAVTRSQALTLPESAADRYFEIAQSDTPKGAVLGGKESLNGVNLLAPVFLVLGAYLAIWRARTDTGRSLHKEIPHLPS